MNQTYNSSTSLPAAARIAVMASGWHRDIVGRGTAAIQAQLERSRIPPDHIDHFEVPGAFEMPLHAKRLAQSGRYDAIIACALVVNGGIYRHEFVAAAVIDGLMRVQLETETPVLSAVLTPRDFHDHEEHQHFFSEHLVKKGTEVALACVATLDSLASLPRGRRSTHCCRPCSAPAASSTAMARGTPPRRPGLTCCASWRPSRAGAS